MITNTVLIAGGTGLVGNLLSQSLRDKGYQVRHVGRSKNLNAEFPCYAWDIYKGEMDESALENVNIIINLTGAGIADERWTAKRKKLLADSRVFSNVTLSKYIAQSSSKIDFFVGASAIGFYGDSGDKILTEDDTAGNEFMSEICAAWEKSAITCASSNNIPYALVRIGVVLSTNGGALPKILLPFKFGVGNYFGNGKMYYSWIHEKDLAKMIIHIIENRAAGIFNGVAPESLTNKQFTKTIGEVLKKPLLFPAPSFALQLLLGEMSSVVLNSNRVSAEKIMKTGFEFNFLNLNQAIRDLLKKDK